jgi:hypothetical protein
VKTQVFQDKGHPELGSGTWQVKVAQWIAITKQKKHLASEY